MPALSEVEIEKLYNGEYWVNRYHLSVGIADALAPAQAILAAERTVTDSRIIFTKMNVRTTAVGDEQYFTQAVNQMGLANNSAADLLPLFNVVRVDFSAIIGRPSRKYLRGLLIEPATSAFAIITQYLDAF